MALQKSGGSFNNGNFVILKPSRKEKDGAVYLKVSVKNKETDKWEESGDKDFKSVIGDLVKVSVKQEEYKGKPYDKIEILLSDPEAGETYLLDLRKSNTTRGLFNSLFSLKTFENVKITYAENKGGYETFYVNQNGEKISWKYSLDEQPKPEVVDIKDPDGNIIETKKYFVKLEKFYAEKIAEFANVVEAAQRNQKREVEAKIEDDSEVPF